MTLRRSNEATSALFERFLVLGKPSLQTMENACNAASERQTFVSSKFHKRVSRSYDNLNGHFLPVFEWSRFSGLSERTIGKYCSLPIFCKTSTTSSSTVNRWSSNYVPLEAETQQRGHGLTTFGRPMENCTGLILIKDKPFRTKKYTVFLCRETNLIFRYQQIDFEIKAR